jgi:hypothetical protein
MSEWTKRLSEEKETEFTVRELNSILAEAEVYAKGSADELAILWELDDETKSHLKEKIEGVYETLLQGNTTHALFDNIDTTLTHRYPETVEALRERLLGNALSEEMEHFSQFGINDWLPDHLQNADATRVLFDNIQAGLERVIEHAEELVSTRKGGIPSVG